MMTQSDLQDTLKIMGSTSHRRNKTIRGTLDQPRKPKGASSKWPRVKYLKLVAVPIVFAAIPAWAQSLTGPQSNAVRSAQQYLSMSGFSRNGLIRQLSSDAGDGYSVTDATAAVDSLNVDWNVEAVKSAKQYLGMSGFSCKGLINQLSSSAGDQYTLSQASYGAHQAGACQ